jgi:NAD(P)-dependent dehydrogenase (short-subunit alcohol dehydrogenase family)
MQLANRVAWITGGGKRLGRAIALELARRGCHLAIHYGRSAAEAHEVARAAEELGRRAIVYRADLARVEEIRSMAGQIENEFGGLDILINTAANFDRVALEEIDEAAWDRALDVNLKGSAFCALEAARLMRLKRDSGATLLAPAMATASAISPVTINLDDPDPALLSGTYDAPAPEAEVRSMPALWGKIINFADWSALRPYRNYLPYMISKGGVVTLTEALAQELSPEITVNAIAPGTVLPPAQTGAAELEKIAGNVPLQRLGAPQDVVDAVLFLLEGGDYITGQILRVDGGRYLAQPGRG